MAVRRAAPKKAEPEASRKRNRPAAAGSRAAAPESVDDSSPAAAPAPARIDLERLAPAARALAAGTPPLYIGTSGFSYTEWRGFFYPDKLASKGFLPFYAACFPTTEINNTFYRIPRLAMTEQWAAAVPDDFRFTLKLSQRVTHIKRLKDVDQEMSWFAAAALGLGSKLGPVLVQLPPNFKKDVERLAAFLAKHAPRVNLAFEFRHASWFDDEVYTLLRSHNAGFAVVEMEEGDTLPRPRLVTGPFVYMRLRKGLYAPGELADWAAWMRSQSVPVYCYLKHDNQAPVLAAALVQAFTPGAP